jgi:hypothetical protein
MTRASAALSATIHEAMHTDEARVIDAWRLPYKPSAWRQVVEEIVTAPLWMQLSVAVFYGFAVGLTVAICAGWTK